MSPSCYVFDSTKSAHARLRLFASMKRLQPAVMENCSQNPACLSRAWTPRWQLAPRQAGTSSVFQQPAQLGHHIIPAFHLDWFKIIFMYKNLAPSLLADMLIIWIPARSSQQPRSLRALIELLPAAIQLYLHLLRPLQLEQHLLNIPLHNLGEVGGDFALHKPWVNLIAVVRPSICQECEHFTFWGKGTSCLSFDTYLGILRKIHTLFWVTFRWACSCS